MMQHHKYSLTELENMMPWEREIYIGLLQKYIKEENERIEKQNAEARSKRQRGKMGNITKTVDPKIAAKDTNGDGHISLKELKWTWNLNVKNQKMQMQ